jgi:peptidoglycan/xylan/chitin deacetylase (PgdA/CDA1 family)
MLVEASAGLPAGVARPEAIAARLERLGVDLVWREPDVVHDAAALSEVAYARGVSSVDLLRGDASLVRELQIGAWFDSPWLPRLIRRFGPLALLPARAATRKVARLSLDAAFWSGVRSRATAREWARLTASSYVALLYHRIAPVVPPDEERLYVTPGAFDRQVRMLRLLRFRPLSPDELTRFHEDPTATLPRRRYVVTADDGFLDAVDAFRRHPAIDPLAFVITQLVAAGRVPWSSAPLASWSQLRAANRDGVAIGAHTRSHLSLPDATDAQLWDELRGSSEDLRQLDAAMPIVAYPHGRHDASVREAAARAGFKAGFSTAPGRNAAGTDPYSLGRISVKAWDSRVSFLWKVLTGQPLPPAWERIRFRRYSKQFRGGSRDARSSL